MQLLEELKKRHVFRVAAFYVGVAWIMLQLADVILPAFEAPTWVFRALIAVIVAGFFVAVVMAWLYEFTAEGLKREEDIRRGKFKPLFVGRQMDFVVISILAIALGISLYGNLQPGAPVAPVVHEPVSVLIADFQNTTGDAVFEGALEQAFGIGLEGASFVTAYSRPGAARIAEEIKAGSKLDEEAARLVAVREGVKVVIAGSVAPAGDGFELAAKVLDPTDGKPLAEESVDATSKAEVLTAVGTLAARVREALGDETVQSGQLAAGESFTAASLEAASDYVKAQDLARLGKDEDAIELYQKAVAADPEFARAYSGWGLSAFYLGRRTEAHEQWKKALSLLDRMSERERYRTLGLYYMVVTENYEKAIENYEQLVQLYPADGAGHNNLSVAYFMTLQLPKAVEESKRVLDIYPRSTLYRANYALNAMWAGDVETAAAEAATVLEQQPSYYTAYLPIAAAALSKPDMTAARAAYERMAATGAPGASLAATGLADLAMVEGHHAEAERLALAGIEADLANQDEVGVGTKSIVLVEAYAAQGRKADALAVLEKLPMEREGDGVAVSAALVYITAGRPGPALAIATTLGSRLGHQPRAYAKLIEGVAALASGRHIAAIDALRAALQLVDLWIVRLHLGRAYLAAGYPAEAVSEFRACAKRRGEAVAMFFDDVPTWRYTAGLPQYIVQANKRLLEDLNAPASSR